MTRVGSNEQNGKIIDHLGTRTVELQFHGGLALTIVLALIAYARVVSFQFLNWDDSVYIVNRPEIHEGLSLTGIRWAFTTFQNANWHPLTWLSHMLDIQLFGIDSGMMHLTNLVIHCANVVLVAMVVRGLTARPMFGLLTAAFFAVHPQHVEVVAWVSERKELLSAFFGLLTMLMWQKFEVSGRHCHWWWANGLYVLALLSKQMLVTLPFLLLVLAVCPLKPGEQTIAWQQVSRVAPRLWLFFLLSLGFSICVFIAQRSGGAVVSVDVLPMWMRCCNAVKSLFLYIAQTFVPIGLNPFYRYQDVSLSLALFSLMVVSLVLVSVWVWKNRSRPTILAGWLWFLGTLVPVLGFVQLAAAARADRYVYFPHIGLFLLIAGLPARSSSFFVLFRKTIISAIVVLFAVATYQQSLIWSNSVSLWTACVKVDPDSYRGHDLLAQAYLREEKVEEAIKQARIAFLYAENSESLDAFMTLGSALLIQGDTAGAIENLREAIRIRPSNPAALINLGYALHEADLAESTKLFEMARKLEPRNTEAIGNLANCEAEAGNLQRAIELLREAIRISPKDERLRQNLKTFETALRNSRG